MPIYKLSASNLSASVRRSQPTPSDAVSVGAKVNGDVVVSESRGQDKDNLYTQRPSPAEREIGFDPKKSSSFNRKESIIEREIREQLRRESELAALRGLPTLVGVSLDQVDQNEDHHHHHHQTPDPSWSYYEVQVLPPEHHRSPSREERKLTVIRSPGGATSSTMISSTTTTTTTTTTSTTPSVNGSKPGKADYHREEHDIVEQKGREEEEGDRRRRRKELGVDLEAENLTNERWTEGKSQQRTEKSGDVFDSGAVDWNAAKTEKKTGEDPHAVRELWSPSGDVQRNLHRVQPFEEVDSIQSELFARYVPQSETPIEGEIRRANEREEALRAARGLVSLVSRDSEGAAAAEEIEVVVRPPRMVEGGGGGGVGDHSTQENHAMKKFAENRLRAELEREKRREMDLLMEGKIQLLSEQRVPEFLEPSSSPSRSKVSSETEELREFAKRRSLVEYRNSESDVALPGAGRRNTVAAAAAENRTAFSANPRMSYGGDKGVTVVWSDARTSSNVNGSGEAGGVKTNSVTEAEQRIEKEIAELRKRESELRQRRRSRSSDIPVEASTAQPEVAEEHGAHAQAAKPEVVAPTSSEAAVRRRQPEFRFDGDYDSVDLGRPSRLALIDQWERGIIQRGGITT